MIRIVAKIDGMMCSMCAAHVNDAIRRDFKVKRVSASHTKGSVEILSECDISDEQLEATLSALGYRLLVSTREPYQKKGFFASLLGR